MEVSGKGKIFSQKADKNPYINWMGILDLRVKGLSFLKNFSVNIGSKNRKAVSSILGTAFLSSH